MPDEIILHPNVIAAWCAFIVALGAVAGYAFKAMKPITQPIKVMQSEISDIEEHRESCDKKFEEHEELILSLKQDVKAILECELLLMKHIETGNCTGEVAAGRAKLEKYLINR